MLANIHENERIAVNLLSSLVLRHFHLCPFFKSWIQCCICLRLHQLHLWRSLLVQTRIANDFLTNCIVVPMCCLRMNPSAQDRRWKTTGSGILFLDLTQWNDQLIPQAMEGEGSSQNVAKGGSKNKVAIETTWWWLWFVATCDIAYQMKILKYLNVQRKKGIIF